ncbi:MAG: carbohydrate-binding domain-containing protein [Promethearchaeota archaeon]
MKEMIALVSGLLVIFLILSFIHSADTNETTMNAVDKDVEKYIWTSYQNSDVILNGNSINLDGGGAIIDGSTITIVTSGTYEISGTLDNGQIIVDTKGSDVVTLILKNANVTCSTSAPIYVINAGETIISLAEGTENYITDGSSYVYADSTSYDPNAAIFSKDDLTITGKGSLIVDANYNNGIQSKDDLEINGGNISVNAVNDGIKGRDSIIIKGATITINAGADGMQSNNDEDEEKGYVTIESGMFDITDKEDGIQAETSLTINGGNIKITSGTKGLKAGVDITINDGIIDISSNDDTINSNNAVTINDGTLNLATSDDGIHADLTLEINGGDIVITKSYEGLESQSITINDGNIHLVSYDDGINAVTNTAGETTTGWGGRPNPMEESGDNNLYINGGYLIVDAGGDGLDINGPISITDGTVIINGPTNDGNGALDYGSSCKVTGGFLLAVGSAGMAQAPSTTSTQYSVKVTYSSTQSANTLVHIETDDGEDILAFEPTKSYQSVVLCSSELESGETYIVYSGGSSTGSKTDGLYSSGTYSGGTLVTTFTISSMVTNAGSGNSGWGGGTPGGGRHP